MGGLLVSYMKHLKNKFYKKYQLYLYIVHDISKTETVPIHPDPTLKIPIPSHPIPRNSYPVPSRRSALVVMVMHGGGMVAITYIFAIIIVRLARYVLHDAQRRRRRGGVRHHARRRRRRGGDSVRTSRALRSDAVRTGRSISLNTLITAATLNIRYEKNVNRLVTKN